MEADDMIFGLGGMVIGILTCGVRCSGDSQGMEGTFISSRIMMRTGTDIIWGGHQWGGDKADSRTILMGSLPGHLFRLVGGFGRDVGSNGGKRQILVE